MFNGTKSSKEPKDFDSFLAKNNLNFSFLKSAHSDCFGEMDSVFKEKYNRNSTIFGDEDYWQEVTGWIALWH